MAVALDTLAYARRLREAGYSERQAEAHAEALAAAMTDTLATKQDLRELETRMDARFSQVVSRFEYLERHLDTRLAEQEKRTEIRFAEQAARFDSRLSDMEHLITVRLGGMVVGGIGVVSVLAGLL
jgi:hypothetical protein